jgi:hypothetical protein
LQPLWLTKMASAYRRFPVGVGVYQDIPLASTHA